MVPLQSVVCHQDSTLKPLVDGSVVHYCLLLRGSSHSKLDILLNVKKLIERVPTLFGKLVRCSAHGHSLQDQMVTDATGYTLGFIATQRF